MKDLMLINASVYLFLFRTNKCDSIYWLASIHREISSYLRVATLKKTDGAFNVETKVQNRTITFN